MISLTKNDIFAFALFYIYQCHLQLFSFHVPIQLTQKQMRNPVYMYANMFFYTFVPFPVILYHIHICIYIYILFVFSFAFIMLYSKHLHITTLWHRYFRGPPPLWTDLRCCRQSGRSCSSSRPSGNIDSLTFLINSGFTYSFGNSSTLT